MTFDRVFWCGPGVLPGHTTWAPGPWPRFPAPNPYPSLAAGSSTSHEGRSPQTGTPHIAFPTGARPITGAGCVFGSRPRHGPCREGGKGRSQRRKRAPRNKCGTPLRSGDIGAVAEQTKPFGVWIRRSPPVGRQDAECPVSKLGRGQFAMADVTHYGVSRAAESVCAATRTLPVQVKPGRNTRCAANGCTQPRPPA